MINRYFYKSLFAKFIDSSVDDIFGQLSRNDEMDTSSTQKFAWEEEIKILQTALTPWKQEKGEVIFEYTIPRLGKRIDVILLLRERVFVLEFKAGEANFLIQDVDQVMDYVLDLKNFHQGSSDRPIIPILVATESKQDISNNKLQHYSDGIYKPLLTNADNLSSIIKMVLADIVAPKKYAVALYDWARSRYEPTPTIIEAARALYMNHSVEEITRHEAEGEQLERTTRYVQDVIRTTKAKHSKSICFVTGVPGAGKTLVGLNVAVQQESDEDLAVYLSGNKPLVDVLTEALTRDRLAKDKVNGKKTTKKFAQSEVKRFIQIIHDYRDNMLQKVHVVNGHIEIDPTKELKDSKAGYGEVENIAIFDEAQRSWDKTHIAAWLNRKKGLANFPMSEGEFLIWSLDQRKDWAVIVCLVGGGQEINTGEAGISEWIRALNDTFPDWNIFISNQLTAKEYAEGNIKNLLANNKHVTYSNDLHLSVSMRSFRAEKLSNMVHLLLDCEPEKAKQEYFHFAQKYTIALTRDIEKAKNWLREKARGNERYGIIASSKAARLKPLSVDVRCKPNIVNWFLDGNDDVRSSLFLEDVASEFDTQGLELDWSCLVWDGDLRHNGKNWEYYEFNGSNKWNRINKPARQSYQLNAYRVLLTRARQGMVICVPYGNEKKNADGFPEDPTRLPKFYDGTYNYLKSLGLKEL